MKLSFLFLLNSAHFNTIGQSYQKQKGSGTNDQSLFRPWKKFRKIHLFIYVANIWPSFMMYIMYISFWWVIPEIKSENLCIQVNSWHHKLFHFHLSLWIWKVWKGTKRITKTWISRERKELEDIGKRLRT